MIRMHAGNRNLDVVYLLILGKKIGEKRKDLQSINVATNEDDSLGCN